MYFGRDAIPRAVVYRTVLQLFGNMEENVLDYILGNNDNFDEDLDAKYDENSTKRNVQPVQKVPPIQVRVLGSETPDSFSNFNLNNLMQKYGLDSASKTQENVVSSSRTGGSETKKVLVTKETVEEVEVEQASRANIVERKCHSVSTFDVFSNNGHCL